MRAEAPGFAFRIKENGFLKTKIRAAGNVSTVRRGGNLAPSNFFVGHASNGEASIRLHDVSGGRLHQVRGDTASLFNDAIKRNFPCPATHNCASAAQGYEDMRGYQA